MNLQELDVFLRTNTESENWHLAHPDELSVRYRSMPKVTHNDQKIYLFDFTQEFMNEGVVMIKESRYTELFAHCHKYLEINYVYSGQCCFHINDSEIIMQQGDLCIMEEGTVHSADYKGENDIVINIVLKENYYSENFLSSLNRKKIISSFIMNHYNHLVEHNHFLLFHGCHNELFELSMKSMLGLYFSERTVGFYSLLNEYIRMMFLHLSMMEVDDSNSSYDKEENSILAAMIHEIHDHYSDCTLRDIANKYGYNYTYVGNMIKKKTGHTFSELKLEQQLFAAREMLLYTKLPVGEICHRCGISNQTFFYHKFKQFFGCLPGSVRS